MFRPCCSIPYHNYQSSCCAYQLVAHFVSDPASKADGIRTFAFKLDSATILDQVQRAPMTQNVERRLQQTHSRGYVPHRALYDTRLRHKYHRGVQVSRLGGVADFLCAPLKYGSSSDLHSLQQASNLYRTLSTYVPSYQVFANHQIEVEAIPSANVTGKHELMEEAIQKSRDLSPVISQEFDYVVVIDFEATCDKNMASLKPQEIIEFPSVLVDCRKLTVGDCFQTYVRPQHHPTLTDFCTHLTGIQQEQVDKGMLLEEAIYWHDKWLENRGIKDTNFAILIWSDWDCKTMLEAECKLKGLDKPVYFNRWINLKALFQTAFSGRKCNLRKAVEVSGLKWKGRAHCGLDDAMNTARLALELMKRGTVLTVTGSLESPISSAPLATEMDLRPAATDEKASCERRDARGGTHAHDVNDDVLAGVNVAMECYCGVACKRQMIEKPGPAYGKLFLACGRWTPTTGRRCGFFQWAAD